MTLPKTMNVRLRIRNVLRLSFFDSELLKHLQPHDGFENLKERFREGVGQHDSVDIDQKQPV